MALDTVKIPSIEQLREIAEELGFTFSDADLAAHRESLLPSFEAYNQLDRMPDELPPVTYPRLPGRRPLPEENRHGAWYVKTEIEGAASGKLKGKKVALKDNICLAGVPMMNGASTMEGYVPEIDATVVTRILDAGGTIAGKTVCEYFCFSGGSHTSASGPVHNPHRMGYSAGGSSSGSAAVVAAGEVPMALGGDQGGSIRIPASFCGIYGLKPTHGLVPYTGIMPIELTLDHTGPMTATVEDNALLLEVLAGPDGLDPRQYGAVAKPYREALGRGAAGLKIAVLEEGFGHPQATAGRRHRPRRGGTLQGTGSERRDGVNTDASAGYGDLAAGSRRGWHDADDAGQRLRVQLAGPLPHLNAGLPQRLADPSRRAVRQP
jgi:amidase